MAALLTILALPHNHGETLGKTHTIVGPRNKGGTLFHLVHGDVWPSCPFTGFHQSLPWIFFQCPGRCMWDEVKGSTGRLVDDFHDGDFSWETAGKIPHCWQSELLYFDFDTIISMIFTCMFSLHDIDIYFYAHTHIHHQVRVLENSRMNTYFRHVKLCGRQPNRVSPLFVNMCSND